MKVVEFLKNIEEIGYDENTELRFDVLSHKHGKGVMFQVESIIDEREYNNENAISVEFDDSLIDVIKNMEQAKDCS